VETREIAMLQEVGIYAYRHPVDSALAYRQRLEEARARMKQLVSGDRAVDAQVGWTVNNSREQGERMTRDFKKLMLRAYNAEADNAVRTLKPHTLDRAIERLTKVRATIARLETIMAIQVSEDYHRLRMYELELTADYLSKVEEEKERVRAYANGSGRKPRPAGSSRPRRRSCVRSRRTTRPLTRRQSRLATRRRLRRCGRRSPRSVGLSHRSRRGRRSRALGTCT